MVIASLPKLTSCVVRFALEITHARVFKGITLRLAVWLRQCGVPIIVLACLNAPSAAQTSRWSNVPTKTFVMHKTMGSGIGEVRLYDGGKAGTRIATSLLPWVSGRDQVVLVHGACDGKSYKVVAKLQLEIIPTGVDLNNRPIVQPSPLQEVWDYYSRSPLSRLVNHEQAVVVRDASTSRLDTTWCGELNQRNEGDPLPTAGY